MKLLVCGGAGFIGSNFVRLRLREQRRRDRRARQADLRRAPREPARCRGRPAFSFVHGAIEDPAAVAAAIDGVDAVVNFAAETHVDRSIAEPDAFVRTHALGTYVLLEARARARRALRPGLDRRGLRLDRRGLVHRDLAARALLALQRDEGRRRPARRLLPPHLRPRDADLPRLQQLRPLPVPGEADPADGPQRARTATACRSTATAATFATGCSSRTSRRGIGHVLEHGDAGRGLQRRRPGRVRRTSTSCGGSSSCAARDESLIEYVADRPGHDRRYSLASEKVRALGWSCGDALRRGHRAHRRLVPRQRLVVGADPLAAPTASTTSASTGSRWIARPLRARGRRSKPAPLVARSELADRGDPPAAPSDLTSDTVEIVFLPLTSVCTRAVAVLPVTLIDSIVSVKLSTVLSWLVTICLAAADLVERAAQRAAEHVLADVEPVAGARRRWPAG